MWFWQMTGTRWPAHDKRESRTTFNTATKAWRRLTASQEERSAETAARYDREDARLELEAAEELRVVEEEQRVLEEKCKQEARKQQQQQRRRRAEEAASRVHAARNRVRELPMRPRDASPRIALLAALRGVTGNRLCDWAWVESDPIGSSRVRYSVRDSSPRLELPLDEPDEMMARKRSGPQFEKGDGRPGAPEPTREVSPRVWGRFAKHRAKSAPPQRVALIALAHRHLRTAVRERDAAHMPLPASAK